MNMNIDSPYYVTTNSGKLELTKGAYLTLMKRKNSICKTLQKSKQIIHSNKQSKRTLKKSLNQWKEKIYSANTDLVHMQTRRSSKYMTKSFVVKPDR